jgi:hypothetical protein
VRKNGVSVSTGFRVMTSDGGGCKSTPVLHTTGILGYPSTRSTGLGMFGLEDGGVEESAGSGRSVAIAV